MPLTPVGAFAYTEASAEKHFCDDLTFWSKSSHEMANDANSLLGYSLGKTCVDSLQALYECAQGASPGPSRCVVQLWPGSNDKD